MPQVRVRLRCGGIRLEFEGASALFERALRPLLAPLGEGGSGVRVVRALPPEAETEAAATAAPAAAEATADAAPGPTYEPPRDRFGTFQRQLAVGGGEEAHLVAAYAFFLWNYEKREIFTEDEVAGCFFAQGLPMPPDAAEVYGDLLTQRVLSPGAAENTWRLTSKGRDFVRHHLLSA